MDCGRNADESHHGIAQKDEDNRSMDNHCYVRLGAVSVALLVICGCGGAPSDMPDLGTVSGTITLDGEPLADANVYFRPLDGGRTSRARTDEQGRYELQYNATKEGAKVGGHRVRITTHEEALEEDDGSRTGGRKEKVPKRYNEESELEVEVAAGSNTHDFTLTSK